MSRYSVVDVGSNTIHLLVGEVEGGEVLPVTGEKFSARLGAGVEKTGRLEEQRLALAAEAINFFARIAALNGAPSPEVLATSAVRDAENGAELVERVGEATGLKMRLISGKEEAELGFRGALSALDERLEKVVVVDLGGGLRAAHTGRQVRGDRGAGLAAARHQPHHRALRAGRPAHGRRAGRASGARGGDVAGVGRRGGARGGGRGVGAGVAQAHPGRAHGRTFVEAVG